MICTQTARPGAIASRRRERSVIRARIGVSPTRTCTRTATRPVVASTALTCPARILRCCLQMAGLQRQADVPGMDAQRSRLPSGSGPLADAEAAVGKAQAREMVRPPPDARFRSPRRHRRQRWAAGPPARVFRTACRHDAPAVEQNQVINRRATSSGET